MNKKFIFISIFVFFFLYLSWLGVSQNNTFKSNSSAPSTTHSTTPSTVPSAALLITPQPPPFPKNGFQLFCDKIKSNSTNISKSDMLTLWKNLDSKEKETFIQKGNVQKSDYDKHQRILDARRDGPLPEDHSIVLKSEDLIGSYLDRINPSWKSPNSSYIALRDDPKYKLPGEIPEETLERVINYRYQRTKSCFAHIALLAYKYVLNLPRMLNMTDALLRIFGDKESALRGGNTLDFLEGLFSKKTHVFLSMNIVADLHQYGTLVITQFRMDVTFKDHNILSHDTYEEREGWGNHALLIIGHRVENGKNWFLLQNSWKSKQFVEISEEYLAFSQGVVYKIMSPEKKDSLSISTILDNNSEMEFPGDDELLLDE